MKVVVTGASGFFGPGIVERLRAAGHEATGASRHIDGPGTVKMDITDFDQCQRAFAQVPGVEAIVHAAALAHVKPGHIAQGLCAQVNRDGTANVVKAARRAGVRRFVFISSVMVYGDFDLPVPVREGDQLVSTNVYGAAKREAEAICADAGFEALHILRMATMYSPDWLSNIRKRVRPLSRGYPVYFTLDPSTRRYSLCSRRNGAEAVLWAVEGRLPAGIYNVADHYDYNQREILEAVERTEGTGIRLPIPVAGPRLLWALARTLASGPARDNAHSRYWKFCEHNLYSSDRLFEAGLNTPPDLLLVGDDDKVVRRQNVV